MHFSRALVRCVFNLFLLFAGISKWVRKRVAKFTNFVEAISSLKEFSSARKLDPCPSTTSSNSLSQMSRSTVETPAKDYGVHTNLNPSVEHTPLGKAHFDPNGGFTPGQCVNTDHLNGSSVEALASAHVVHTETKPSLEHTASSKAEIVSNTGFTQGQSCLNNIKPISVYTVLANPQGNTNGGLTPGQSIHTDRKPSVESTQLTNAHGNPSGLPASTEISSGFSGVAPKSLFFRARKNSNADMKNVDQGTMERKVFNGMAITLDYNPVNGFSLTRMKCTELRPDGNGDNEATNSAVKMTPESETLSEEQLQSSPVLFATPSTTPSSSPVKTEPNLFNFSQGVNSSKLNLVGHEPSEIQRLRSKGFDASEDSVDSVKKGDSNINPSLAKGDNDEAALAKGDDLIETSLAPDGENQPCFPSRKLLRSKKTVPDVSDRKKHGDEAQEEKRARDLLDDVKDNIALEGAYEHENSLQSTGIKVECDVDSNLVTSCSKRSERSSKSASEMPSNVRQTTRRSSRLRRTSVGTGDTRKKQEVTSEVRAISLRNLAQIRRCCLSLRIAYIAFKFSFEDLVQYQSYMPKLIIIIIICFTPF